MGEVSRGGQGVGEQGRRAVTWVLLALRFAKKNWKAIAVALVIGSLIAAYGFLYGAWQIEKGRAAKFEAERDAARATLATAVAINEEWDRMAVTWNQAVDDMRTESEGYQARLAAERTRRRTTESRLAELEAEVSDQITATDCEGALVQLVDALGWGAP